MIIKRTAVPVNVVNNRLEKSVLKGRSRDDSKCRLCLCSLTYSTLTDDPGEPEEEHHPPDVEQAPHL
jgi:hypothetical protein